MKLADEKAVAVPVRIVPPKVTPLKDDIILDTERVLLNIYDFYLIIIYLLSKTKKSYM